MRPTILKLLRQEPVSRAEWHELFWSVHMVCLWDEKSHAKMYKALQDDILEFIKQAQTVRQFFYKENGDTLNHSFIFSSKSIEGSYPWRRPIFIEGIYQWVEEVFHPMLLFANAFFSTGNCSSRQESQFNSKEAPTEHWWQLSEKG